MICDSYNIWLVDQSGERKLAGYLLTGKPRVDVTTRRQQACLRVLFLMGDPLLFIKLLLRRSCRSSKERTRMRSFKARGHVVSTRT